MGYVSMDGNNGGSSEVVAENAECGDCLLIKSVSRRRAVTQRIAYWVVDCITVPQPCREGWVNELVCVLKRVEVWIDPRQL